MKEEIKSSSITSEKNDLYCSQYAGYTLNNWGGLASLWSNIHLGCQSKHSREQSYLEWSKTFGNCDCVTNPPRTQGIIELHQKIMKHVTFSTKKTKSWFSYCWLKVKEDIFSSTLSNQFVQNRKKAKLATENYAKSKKLKFSYQKPPSGVKIDRIINEVSSSDPNKKKVRKRSYKFNLIFLKKVFWKGKKKKRKNMKLRSTKRCVKSYRWKVSSMWQFQVSSWCYILNMRSLC